MKDFDISSEFNISSEGYESGKSSQDKGKGKEKEIVNRFTDPPQPNQNYPRLQMPYRWPTPETTNDNIDDPDTSDHLQDRFCLGCMRVLPRPFSGPTCVSCEEIPRLQSSGAMNPPAKRYCIVCARGISPPEIVCQEHDEKQDSLREFEINILREFPRMCKECGKGEREVSEKELFNRCKNERRIEYHQTRLALEQVPKGRPPK